jgi:endonuclease/exonuclease/phosphatase family metal-dependent hydrolase
MKRIHILLFFLLLCCGRSIGQSLRLLTYNIHHAQNESGVIDVKGIADFILKTNPDLVALQEVDSVCSRSKKIDIAAELGRLTGMYYYFGKAMNYDGGGYGEAVLSRLPIVSISTVTLPFQADKKREPRAAIEAVVQLSKDKTLKFVATHLDHLDDETDRLMQTGFLTERYQNESLPFILAGDLNATPGSKAMQNLFKVATQPAKDNNAPTYPSGVPEKKIDYFLLSKNQPWQCTRFEVPEEKNISDHRPVLMELKLN